MNYIIFYMESDFNLNKKKCLLIILLLCLFLAIFFCYYYLIYLPFKRKISFENSSIQFYQSSKDADFSISKMIFYSSAYGKNKNSNFDGNNWILDLYQFTDFAFYINPTSEDNYVKSIWLDNLQFLKEPTLGKASIYYEDALRFGTEYISTNYQFQDKLDFTVVNDPNTENDIKYNTPVFFSDCSTPISLKFVNNVANNLSLKNVTTITQNGTILSHAMNNVLVLDTTFRFTVNLIDIHNVKHSADLSIHIPLSDGRKDILSNGSIIKIIDKLDLKLICN